MLQRLSSVVLVLSRCDTEYVDSLLALVSPVDEEPELAVVDPLLVVVPEPDVLLVVVVELEPLHAPL